MKMKILKFLKNPQLLFFGVVLLLLQSCGRSECGPPDEKIGSVTLKIGITNPLGPCNFTNDLIPKLKTLGMNALVSEKNEDPTKWVIELIVGGTCSDDAAWMTVFKKANFNVQTSTVNFGQNLDALSITMNDLPKSFSKKITVTVRVLSPCRNATCSFGQGLPSVTNYRVLFGANPVELNDAKNGDTFTTNNVLGDVNVESCN
jgi:hypothetical protein